VPAGDTERDLTYDVAAGEYMSGNLNRDEFAYSRRVHCLWQAEPGRVPAAVSGRCFVHLPEPIDIDTGEMLWNAGSVSARAIMGADLATLKGIDLKLGTKPRFRIPMQPSAEPPPSCEFCSAMGTHHFVRTSTGGRLLYSTAYYGEWESAWAVYDTKRRTWTGLKRYGTLQYSAPGWASTAARETLVLDPSETLVATHDCRKSRIENGYALPKVSRECAPELEIVDLAGGRRQALLATREASAAIAWAPDGSQIATGLPVTVWNVAGKTPIATFEQRVSSGLAWLDGKRLAGSTDSELWIWERTGESLESPWISRHIALLPRGFRPFGVAAVPAVDGPVVAVVGRWGAAAAVRWHRLSDGAILSLRADATPLGTAVWFLDSGQYDTAAGFDVIGRIVPVCGETKPGCAEVPIAPTLDAVHAVRRVPALWERFWTGGRLAPLEHAAGTTVPPPAIVLEDHEGKPLTDLPPGLTAERWCDLTLCIVKKTECPDGYRLNPQNTRGCVPANASPSGS
jgi:hypothetical protein